MKISALVLVKDEEEMIEDCLKQLSFADEIIVLDQGSKDKTREITAKYTKKIYSTNFNSFSQNRNTLSQMAKGEWLFYIDADERIDDNLISEIKRAVNQDKYSAFYFPRKNFILGKWLKHTGFWPDYVPKLFKREKLIKWQGVVHESPEIEGSFETLKTPLVHLTAQSMSGMFKKSIKWAKIEAELSFQNNHPRVTILKVTKAMFFEFLNRFFVKKGFLDGTTGFIESIYQALHAAMVLTYLWERQTHD